MRLGLIRSMQVTGEKTTITATVSGDHEPDIVLLVPLGVDYTPAENDPVMLLEFGDQPGEWAAIPMQYRRAGIASDFVALKADVDALDTRVDSLEANAQAHTHTSAASGSPTSPPISWPGTSATLEGSNRFKVTHG